MSSKLREFLEESLKEKPDLLRSEDLIELGLFTSFSDVSASKRRGITPPHVQLSSKKIFYPKQGVIEWIILNDNRMREIKAC